MFFLRVPFRGSFKGFLLRVPFQGSFRAIFQGVSTLGLGLESRVRGFLWVFSLVVTGFGV